VRAPERVIRAQCQGTAVTVQVHVEPVYENKMVLIHVVRHCQTFTDLSSVHVVNDFYWVG